MPVTSHQMSGMIGGQQAMFGNFASYATQISPGYGGPPPTYSNPMQGAGMPAAQHPLSGGSGSGAGAMSWAGNKALPMAASAAMFMPGLSRLDPTMAAIRGFGASSGINTGGAGLLSKAGMSNIGAGFSQAASGGIGGLARAGLSGIGGAAARAMPVLALAQAAKYGVGQMVQGAQYNNQVSGFMQKNFSHVNQASSTGFGFSRDEGGQMGDMMREMGNKDMMSGPQEMLRIMKQGTQQGVFKAVQDVKEFKRRFKETVGALKEVAKVMNTTLEGAMPFFQQARQQGFWTPQDIQRHAQTTKAAAGASGMSVAQTQQMMGQGAAMARQVGAQGHTGSQGMAASLSTVGGALRSGVINERQLSEATGGQTGTEAIGTMAGQMQASATRFATSRRARWLLASLGGKGFKSLDSGKVGMLQMGMMGIGDIGKGARQNIGKEGAFNFVQNEETLRGELLKGGIATQSGFVQALVGKHLYGASARSKFITRRIIKQTFGGSNKNADMLAAMGRNAARIREENEARDAQQVDQQERNRSEIMDHSYEGAKRKMSSWWDKKVKEPLQGLGARVGRKAGNWWEKQTDAFWGRAPRGFRNRGFTGQTMKAAQRHMLGDTSALARTFGRSGSADQFTKGGGLGEITDDLGRAQSSSQNYLQASMAGGNTGGWMNVAGGAMFGMGRMETKQMGALRDLGVGEYTYKTAADREKAIKGGGMLRAGVSTESAAGAFRAMAVEDVEKAMKGLHFAQGQRTKESAQSVGFKTVEAANQAIQKTRDDFNEGQFVRQAADIKRMMPEASGMQRARRMVQDIRSGKMGTQNMRDLVKGGDINQAAFRLIGAQSKAFKDTTGGVNLSETAAALGEFGIVGGQDVEKQIADKMGSLAFGLTHYTAKQTMEDKGLSSTGGMGMGKVMAGKLKEGQQASLMKLFSGSDAVSNQFKEALTYMATGKPEDAKKGRDMLAALSGNTSLTKEQQEVLSKVSNPDNPDRKNLDKILGQMGKLTGVQGRVAAEEAIGRRARRMSSSMGENQEMILSNLNKMTESKSGEGLGDAVRKMMTDPGEQTIEGMTRNLEKVTQMASEADPKQALRAFASLKGIQGAEGIRAAIAGGAKLKAGVAGLAAGSAKSIGLANYVLGGFGTGGLKTEDLKKLKAGGDQAEEVRKRVVGNLQGTEKKRTEEFLSAIQNKDQSKLLELGRRAVGARAVGTMGNPKDTILGAGAGNLVGRLGSREGMHVELTRQTALLESINKEMGGKPVIGGKKGGGGKGDKKAEGK